MLPRANQPNEAVVRHDGSLAKTCDWLIWGLSVASETRRLQDRLESVLIGKQSRFVLGRGGAVVKRLKMTTYQY